MPFLKGFRARGAAFSVDSFQDLLPCFQQASNKKEPTFESGAHCHSRRAQKRNVSRFWIFENLISTLYWIRFLNEFVRLGSEFKLILLEDLDIFFIECVGFHCSQVS